MAGETLYEILEVSKTASQETIRSAWDRLSEKWDPMLPGNADANARRQYAAITNAYLTLGNAHKRAAYDQTLQAEAPAPVAQPASSISGKASASVPTPAARQRDVRLHGIGSKTESRDRLPQAAAQRDVPLKPLQAVARVAEKRPRPPVKKTTQARSGIILAFIGALAVAAYQYSANELEGRTHATIPPVAGGEAERAAAEAQTRAEVERAPPQGHERRDRAESLALRLDAEFGSSPATRK